MEVSRSVMPSTGAIARYWERSDDPYLGIDLGEPSCFACGWYFPSKPMVSGNASDEAIDKVWSAAGLERAHIVPHSIAGSSDDPGDYLLLCADCHEYAPDVPDRAFMLRWVVAQPGRLPGYMGVLMERFERDPIVRTTIERLSSLPREEISRVMAEAASDKRVGLHFTKRHGARLSAGTVAWLILQHLE